MNKHIKTNHELDKELTTESAKSYERIFDLNNIDEQIIPERILKYYKGLR